MDWFKLTFVVVLVLGVFHVAWCSLNEEPSAESSIALESSEETSLVIDGDTSNDLGINSEENDDGIQGRTEISIQLDEVSSAEDSILLESSKKGGLQFVTKASTQLDEVSSDWPITGEGASYQIFVSISMTLLLLTGVIMSYITYLSTH